MNSEVFCPCEFLHHLKIGWNSCFTNARLWKIHLTIGFYNEDVFWWYLNGHGVDDFHVWVDL